ncbi:MAG: LacI family DNA-binding transcriptional regulator [Bacteroidales bacterium]
MIKKTSLADIAASLGVSKTLVSLVLNDKADRYGISRETQTRVRERIAELNYRPDALARVFRTGKTLNIGLLVPDISNVFCAAMARSIEKKAWEHAYSLVICSTQDNPDRENKQIRNLLDKRVDGLIISSSQQNPGVFNALSEEGFPHVLIDRTYKDMRSPSVSTDNFWGASMVAGHFLEQGFRHMAMVFVAAEHLSAINDRIMGFTSALSAAGVEIPSRWKIRVPLNDAAGTIEAQLNGLKQAGNMPEAIFALNHRLTSDCLLSLRKLNLDIPGEVALAGFDDMPWFALTRPSVTAVRQPLETIGEQAFNLLKRQMNQTDRKGMEASVHLPVELIIRESSVIRASQPAKQHLP